MKKEPDDWDFFENLPAKYAFKLDRVQISDEQSCKVHLATLDPQNAWLYPESFIVLCTTIMDGWYDPNIEDNELQVRSWIIGQIQVGLNSLFGVCHGIYASSV